MKKEEKKATCENKTSQWKEVILLYIGKALQEVADGLFGKIRSGMERAIEKAVRKIMVLFLMLLGVLLLGLCAVHFLNEMTQTSWVGYGVVGSLFIIVSLLISLVGKNSGE